MGTGIVATLFISIPFQADWLYYLSLVFFVLNVILFTLAFTISVLRYSLYPEIWDVMIADPNNSLFLGTIPMGFATIVEMWIFICIPAWGAPWVSARWPIIMTREDDPLQPVPTSFCTRLHYKHRLRPSPGSFG